MTINRFKYISAEKFKEEFLDTQAEITFEDLLTVAERQPHFHLLLTNFDRHRLNDILTSDQKASQLFEVIGSHQNNLETIKLWLDTLNPFRLYELMYVHQRMQEFTLFGSDDYNPSLKSYFGRRNEHLRAIQNKADEILRLVTDPAKEFEKAPDEFLNRMREWTPANKKIPHYITINDCLQKVITHLNKNNIKPSPQQKDILHLLTGRLYLVAIKANTNPPPEFDKNVEKSWLRLKPENLKFEDNVQVAKYFKNLLRDNSLPKLKSLAYEFKTSLHYLVPQDEKQDNTRKNSYEIYTHLSEGQMYVEKQKGRNCLSMLFSKNLSPIFENLQTDLYACKFEDVEKQLEELNRDQKTMNSIEGGFRTWLEELKSLLQNIPKEPKLQFSELAFKSPRAG